MKQHCEAGNRKTAMATTPILFSIARVSLASIVSMAVLASLTGCKGFFTAVNNNPSGGGTSSFVYVTNLLSAGSAGTLTEYSLTSGVLAQLSGSPITLPAAPTSIVVAPNNKFLFVGTSLGVFVYTIGTDGTLTEGNNSTIVYQGATGTTVASIAVDSTSSWLIIANKNSKELDALPIDPTTGIPTSSTPAHVALDGANPVQVVISPANNNIFVALGEKGTDALSFSPTGTTILGNPINIGLHPAITPPTTPASKSANTVAVDTTSTYLFIGESPSNILRQIAISDLSKDISDPAVGNAPSFILPEATGAYVYVANKDDNTITGFTLGTTGALTSLGVTPFPTAVSPIGLIEDSSKTYIFSAGFGTNPNLWEYNFDSVSAGTLDIKTTTSTGTNSNPSTANGIAATH